MNRSLLWGTLLALLACRSQLKSPEPPACAQPLASCPDSPVCVDLANDPANCGACQTHCPADTTCVRGACQPRCPTGFVRCNPDGGVSACADPRHDPHNCGGCGQACASWEICREGQCDLTCSDGQSLCGEANGRFCTDLRSDNRNCVGCGKACPAGKACRQGNCDDCRMTLSFSERDGIRPMAPLPNYLSVMPRVSGDFNGDGKLDLAVDLGYGQIRVLLGDGTGQLAPGELTTLKAVPTTNTLEAMDIDHDGKLDLVVLTRETTSKLVVLHGQGDGRFVAQKPFALPAQLSLITAADVDRDGVADLVLAGAGNGSSSLFGGVVVVLIAPDGSMRVSDQQATGAVEQMPVVADLTGDGVLDLALPLSRQILIMRGLGQGKFERSNVPFDNWYSVSAGAGDLDGDGRAELIALGFLLNDAGVTTARLGIMDGATGTIRETPTELPSGRAELFVRDVDGDGKLDVIVGGSINSSKAVWVLSGKGNGNLVSGPAQELRASELSLGDFNGDGKPDLVVGSPLLKVCLAKGDGTFERPANRLSETYNYLHAADVDGDGRLDLVAAHRNTLSVLRGQGNGSFREALTTPLKINDGPHAVADFDGDGLADVCCGEERGLLKGQRDGSFLNLVALPSNGCRRLNGMATDVDRDGLLDLVSPEDTSICVMRGQTRTSFAPPQYYPAWVPMDFGAVAVGDVDGDHLQDVVATLSKSSAVAILYGKADGSYEKPVQYEVGSAPSTVALVDWNGDGRPDLVIAGEGGLATLQNLGQRAWGPRFSLATANGVKRILGTDWNGDGLGDLLAISSSFPAMAILSRGDGRFDSTTLDSSQGVYDATVADFNQDGRPDIAINESTSLDVRVFLQKGAACAR